MRSVMSNRFSEIPKAEIARSTFDRSFGRKMTFDADYLVPCMFDLALPGDTINCRMTAFARLNTPIHPLMDNMFMETQFFGIPIRLLWDNWEKFNGAQDDPGDSIDFTIPIIASLATGYLEGTIYDYLEMPTKIATAYNHSALWLRAYYLVWNAWYRDQNLQNSLTVATGNGPDLHTAYTLQKRGKRHDYFTSCLPWPQKSPDGAVTLPLGTRADVKGIAIADGQTPTSYPTLYETGESSTVTYTGWRSVDAAPSAGLANVYVEQASGNYPDIYADLTNATAATINQLRQAFQIQKLQERDARGGTRYVEILKSHFGVTSPDFRLQRPEYLGGGSSMVNISEIAQTSSTDVTTPQGNLAAKGTALLQEHGFTKSFVEHTLILGLVSVRADLTYQQGLNRLYSLSTRYDFYWPSLAQIGEQTVLNKEIWLDGSANDALVFGYQERYAELRYKPSSICGLLRSNATGTLEAWHLSEDFATLPALNATFIASNAEVPIDRAVAVNTEPQFIFDSFFSYQHSRPMPIYGVPGNMDRF